MKIDYYILNPTGNITALVIDNGYTKEEYALITENILNNHSNVEQVGFVNFNNSNPYLHMSGGEFCGNATMSTAALYCKIKCFSEYNGNVNVYGLDTPVSALVSDIGTRFDCSIKLDKPLSIENKIFNFDNKKFDLPIVNLKGISHIVAPIDFDKSIAVNILKKYADELSLPAIGFMLFDEKNGDMLPIVFVKNCNTLFFENSCASGSCAVCAYLAEKGNNDIVFLKQPGGILKANVLDDGNSINLHGTVIVDKHIVKEI